MFQSGEFAYKSMTRALFNIYGTEGVKGEISSHIVLLTSNDPGYEKAYFSAYSKNKDAGQFCILAS